MRPSAATTNVQGSVTSPHSAYGRYQLAGRIGRVDFVGVAVHLDMNEIGPTPVLLRQLRQVGHLGATGCGYAESRRGKGDNRRLAGADGIGYGQAVKRRVGFRAAADGAQVGDVGGGRRIGQWGGVSDGRGAVLRRNGHRRPDGKAFPGSAVVKGGVQFPDAGRFGGGRAGLVKMMLAIKTPRRPSKSQGRKAASARWRTCPLSAPGS